MTGSTLLLSKREVEVMKLLSEGKTNKEISTTLFISVNTTRTHIRAIMQKLQLSNRTNVAVHYITKVSIQ